MARRPVFVPVLTGPPFVDECVLDFRWFSGFAKSQAQKSIHSLHQAARENGLWPVLEISSKSHQRLGVLVSAFNLEIEIHGKKMPVESAFQGSKVFKEGGPFTDLYSASGRIAKRDPRLRSSGELIAFDFFGERWPIEPKTSFYDWLYITALAQNASLARQLRDFNAFSDIAYNPSKSINCQARSAALFVALSRTGLLHYALQGKKQYLDLMTRNVKAGSKSFVQGTLF